jgi:hypothetical protein
MPNTRAGFAIASKIASIEERTAVIVERTARIGAKTSAIGGKTDVTAAVKRGESARGEIYAGLFVIRAEGQGQKPIGA